MGQGRSATPPSGFNADLPHGSNLRDHPEHATDIVLGIDTRGKYYLNTKPIIDEQIGSRLKAMYKTRTGDKVMYVKADRNLPYSRVRSAIDVAGNSGVCVVALISEQRPGTVSLVQGDSEFQDSQAMRKAIDVQLPDLSSLAQRANAKNDRIVLEVLAGRTYLINKEAVPIERLGARLSEIYVPRPEKIVFVRGDPAAKFQDVIYGMDVARGAGVILIGLPPKNFKIPEAIPDIDLAKPVTSRDDSPRCRSLSAPSARTAPVYAAQQVAPAIMDAEQPTYFDFQVERRASARTKVAVPYPVGLQTERVEGEVVVQFVVDTTGRVDMSTFKVLKSTHELFREAVKSHLRELQFTAAEISGRKVRQLVQQSFTFTPAR